MMIEQDMHFIKQEEKPPKYQCQCGSHDSLDYLCSEAFAWFSCFNKRSRQSGTISVEEYTKLKKTYKALLIEQVTKETEN